jgi:CheY-like chemotaxis protein
MTEPADSPNSTILVVDDDAAIRDSVRDLLEAEGYAVCAAVDGEDALDQLSRMKPPNLILLDLRMPRVDGWQFLARRQTAEGQHVPIVLLSGMTFIRDAPGVADFLAKPIRPDKLIACVRRFCAPAGA